MKIEWKIISSKVKQLLDSFKSWIEKYVKANRKNEDLVVLVDLTIFIGPGSSSRRVDFIGGL